tara:strand:+ start:1686 stop:2357 length:672 start_codon:yes stop_codon:yes gene_type:complete
LRQIILNFHGIGNTSRIMEPGEARYWVSPSFFEETLAMADHYKDRVCTDFTFDDGNLSDLEIAAPGLARHGRKAMFFVLADRIGTTGSLGADDIRALAEAGHEIGTHGAAHTDWTSAKPTVLKRELGHITRDAIAMAAGQPVRAAAIPFGRYNSKVLKALSDYGYDRVYSSDGGAWKAGQKPVPRTSPRADMTLKDIENILIGADPVRNRLRRALSGYVKRTL